MGLYRVVILFACVPCPPVKDKKPFLSLSLLVSCLLSSVRVCPSFLGSFHLMADKKETAFIGSFLFGWLCLVSPIERKKGRLQVGCRFGLLPLFCLCLSAFLLPWGLRYNKDSLYLLRPCGLYNGILLLCFSCCFPPAVLVFYKHLPICLGLLQFGCLQIVVSCDTFKLACSFGLSPIIVCNCR